MHLANALLKASQSQHLLESTQSVLEIEVIILTQTQTL